MWVSRWSVLGAVVPLLVGCGGGSSSKTDDRDDFGVEYTTPTSSSESEDGYPLFTRVDTTCLGTKTVDEEEVSITVDLGMSHVVMGFAMEWVNNEFNSQDVELTGDGFRVSIYVIDEVDGSRGEDPVWHSDYDYSGVNDANGNDPDSRYFESLKSDGVEYGVTGDNTEYPCNDDWQAAFLAGTGSTGSDDDEDPNPYRFFHSSGVIGVNDNVNGDEIVGDDDTYIVEIPQSDKLPGREVSGVRSGAGTYLWWGLDTDGSEVSVDNLYEAVLEVRIRKVDAPSEMLTSTFRFRLADVEE